LIAAKLTGGYGAPIPLPPVHLANIGKDEGGASVVDVVGKVFGAIFSTVTDVVAGAGKLVLEGAEGAGKLAVEGASAAGGAALDGAKAVGGVATDGAKAVGGAAADGAKAVGNAAGSVIKGIGGLLGGKAGKEQASETNSASGSMNPGY
jgi:hypothetical protein